MSAIRTAYKWEDALAAFVTNIVGEPDADPRQIPESVVQDVWRRQRFRDLHLQTTQGSEVVVEDPGKLNRDQGPDFVGARVKIDGVTWCGAVEIHRCSADWYRHGHESDTIYNNVVLHATLIADHETGRLKREDGSLLPEIVLLPRLDAPLRRLSWDHRVSAHRKFPCENHWATTPADVVDPFLIDLARSRMRSKALRIAGRFADIRDFDQVVFEETCRVLGFMPNAEPMVLLARRVPLKLAVWLESTFDFLCLLLGTSGLLPEVSEFVMGDRSAIAYALSVRERYLELNRNLRLTPMPRQTWRFSRMRPGNFPTLRIAQAAALFGNGGPLAANPFMSVTSGIVQDDPVRILNGLLTAEPDRYWQHHSNLTKSRDQPRSAVIGAERRAAVVTNAFLPLSSFASEYQNRPELDTAVMRCLDLLPAQTDTVTRPYSKLRGRPTSATITQGIHELSRSWCTEGRCLECPIGRHLSRVGCRLVG